MRPAALACLLALSSPLLASAKDKPAKKSIESATPASAGKPSPWGDWVEKDFPFFSSVLDARDVGEGFPKDNLTPRGLILNLGHNVWACFDTDLLRIACIWQGEEGKTPVTPDALAPGSYHVAGQKTKDGQDFLPKPVGKVFAASGIYPGLQVGAKADFTDPREPGPSKEEVGRGPLPAKAGAFHGLTLDKEGNVTLLYEVGGVAVRERLFVTVAKETATFHRSLVIGAHKDPLILVNPMQAGSGGKRRALTPAPGADVVSGSPAFASAMILPSVAKEGTVEWSDGLSGGSFADGGENQPARAAKDWSPVITTHAALSTSKDAYVIDDINLPTANPWRRNVRLADIAFLNDKGEALAVAFDGDVWHISGLTKDMKDVKWKRFASGLHEPMSIVNRGGEIFVFDRNGIWKLVDSDNDGEADRYEMSCNLFSQTAETREFPNSMKLAPDGALYIAKGGQEGTDFGKHNGTVIRVAPDGKSMAVVGYGLRQPFIGVNPITGLVTASDQQGNYVPSTPLHIIRDHQFYGHLPTIAPKEKYPESIADPLTWIPHPVNPSGVTQVWLAGAKMGPLNDELIHLGYNRPEIFRVLINPRFQKPQAAVTPFSRDFDFGPLNATVNPADGQLYIVGFQVWGTTAKKISGLVRMRYTGASRVLVKEVTPMDKGVLLRFNEPLDPKLAADPASFSAERWNYKRTPEYGSPHLKLDGTPGQDWLTPSSAYLSKDGLGVFVGIPGMKAGVNQMRIGWGLKSTSGGKAENNAYFTPYELARFDSEKEGFGKIDVDLTPRKATTAASAQPTIEEGLRLYQMIGCMACHSIDGSTVGKVGPSWKGLFGAQRIFAKGGDPLIADENYLHESIINPSAKVVKGFEKFDTGMPIYAGILNESQIQSLILFIKSLK